MIDDAPQLQSRLEFARLTPEQIAPFAGKQTGQVVDALGGHGALNHHIKPLFPDQSLLCGNALTCDAGAADNYGVLAALDAAQPGDIVIATTREHMDCAVVGDLVMGMCKNRDIAGFVTDGCVRDSRGIREFGLPCFAAGVSPNSPAKQGPASLGLPIVIGGITVQSGDFIVADEDGVVVIPHGRIAETTERLAQVLKAEDKLLAQVRNGRSSMLNG